MREFFQGVNAWIKWHEVHDPRPLYWIASIIGGLPMGAMIFV